MDKKIKVRPRHSRRTAATVAAIALGSVLVTGTPAMALESTSGTTGSVAAEAISAGTSDSRQASAASELAAAQVSTTTSSTGTSAPTSSSSEDSSASPTATSTTSSSTGSSSTSSSSTASAKQSESRATSDSPSSQQSAQDGNSSTASQAGSSDTSSSAGSAQKSSAGTTDSQQSQATSPDSSSSASQSRSAGKSESSSNAGSSEAASPAIHVSTETHVQDIGWQKPTSEGAVAGTTGQEKRMEAVRIRLVDQDGNQVNGISYKAHVQNIGWQDWVSDGQVAGTAGRSLRIEALKIKLSDELAQAYELWYRTHVKDLGWLAWTKDGISGTVNLGLRVEALEFELVRKASSTPARVPAPSAGNGINSATNGSSASGSASAAIADDTAAFPKSDQGYAYRDNSGINAQAHVQNDGWQGAVSGTSETVGTTGQGKRLEAFKLSLSGFDPETIGADSAIQYRAHVQNVGWQGWASNGQVAGTTGQGLRVEAVQIRLAGGISQLYDVYYRLHVADYGWLDWACDGDSAGTTGLQKRAEAIMVMLVRKNTQSKPTGIAYVAPAHVSYDTRGADGSWRGTTADGGINGNGSQVNQFRANVSSDSGITGSIVYQASTRNVGWEQSTSDGAAQGNADGRGIESVKVHLEGDLARFFDVYYRVCVDQIGWLDWACNGGQAGTTGYDLHAGGIQVVLVAKGNGAPGSCANAWYDVNARPRCEQSLATANAAQRRVVDVCHSMPSPGGGLCACWVEKVMNACGHGYLEQDACDLYRNYCHTSSRPDLKVGMIVAVASHGHTYMGSIYGHVAIYIGDGQVMDNVGRIRTWSLQKWIDYYSDRMPVRWGWYNNQRLA